MSGRYGRSISGRAYAEDRARLLPGNRILSGGNVMAGEQCILPGPSAGRRCAIADTIAADKNEERIWIFAYDFCCRLECLRKTAIGFEIPGDKCDDRWIARFQNAPVRQSQRRVAGQDESSPCRPLHDRRQSDFGLQPDKAFLPMGGADRRHRWRPAREAARYCAISIVCGFQHPDCRRGQIRHRHPPPCRKIHNSQWLALPAGRP